MQATELRFPRSNTRSHSPTVKLAGKLSLSASVVAVSKDRMNYVSQDASRRANEVPLPIPVFLGKWSPSCLKA